MKEVTKCPNEPIYGTHATNGLGPDAACCWCAKPVHEWWVERPEASS